MSSAWDPREHYKDKKVAIEYDQIRFGSLAGRTFDRLEKRALLKALRDVPTTAEIVDIPCGTGRLAEALLAKGYRVTGVDISRAMLDEAQKKLARFGDRFTPLIGDAMRLTEPGRAFAAAVCARVLMHFPLDEQIAFLHNVAKLTNGAVVFNQSYNSTYQRTRRLLKRALHHRMPANFPLAEQQLSELLGRTGLREVRRVWVAPAISEAFFVTAIRLSSA